MSILFSDKAKSSGTGNLVEYLEQRPFVVSSSSGFFGFFSHLGFYKALAHFHLKPKKIKGTSAGAVIGALIASGLSTKEIEAILLGIRKEMFWDPKIGFGLLKGESYQKILEGALPKTFQDLQIPFEVSVFNISQFKTVVMNQGELPTALRASCCVPVMFHPVNMQNQWHWDGGIFDKPALMQIDSKDVNLCHYLKNDRRFENYEYLYHQIKHKKYVNFISLEKIPACSPYKLHLGPDIIEQSYRQSLAYLRKPMNFILDAEL